MAEAQDALGEAIAGRIDDDELIPKPSARRNGEHFITVPTEVAAKAALAIAIRRSVLVLADACKSLDITKQTVSRMLNPRQTTDTSRANQALAGLSRDQKRQARELVK